MNSFSTSRVIGKLEGSGQQKCLRHISVSAREGINRLARSNITENILPVIPRIQKRSNISLESPVGLTGFQLHHRKAMIRAIVKGPVNVKFCGLSVTRTKGDGCYRKMLNGHIHLRGAWRDEGDTGGNNTLQLLPIYFLTTLVSREKVRLFGDEILVGVRTRVRFSFSLVQSAKARAPFPTV